MQPPDLLKIFLLPLEQRNLSYFITGSIASLFYGEPRLTHDIDLVMHLPEQHIESFITLFPSSEFYCPPEEVIQIELRRRPFGHFNLIHHRSGFKADIYPDGEDKLHAWAFQNRKRVEIGSDLSIWIAPPEYIILRKLEYYREGGSQKHLEDIRKMLRQIEAQLDQEFLDNELRSRQLSEQWDLCTKKPRSVND